MTAIPGANASGVQGYAGIGQTDISSMSMEDLLFFVMAERAEILDDSVRGYAEQIERRNELMKLTNDMLSEARYLSANLESGESATMTPELQQFLEANGIDLPDTTAATTTMTVEQQIAVCDELLDWLENDKPYTDNACIDADLSPEMINKARSLGIEPSDDGDGAGQNWESSDFDSFKSLVEQKKNALETQQAGGTAAPVAGTYTKEEWDSIVSSIQGFQEGLNNDSQLDMIKFQSLMSKYSTAIEMLSNAMKKIADTNSSLVRNI